MPSLTCFNIRFTPNWLMIVLTLSFIFIFIRLGLWQIQRADEKVTMIAAEESLAKQEPILWRGEQPLPKQYQRIKVRGTYLPNILLLDNQHHQHQFGYDAVSPLQLSDGSVVLVDRGWVQGESTRRSFPDIQIPQGIIELQGSAYFPGKKQWVLGPGIEKKEGGITILEILDAKLVSQLLQKKVYPFIIRLDKQDAYGFVREWAIVSMPPQRHLAYALQWFAMALVIFIIFVALNLKKRNEEARH
ncbi:SURF1 family protein [Legionella bononiensis]|uniref:SURF1-like protein n=1 Tax=Legionella bononiensis TaxID=2793102 RepID=A0ABS1W975_9GAMM|nr:SURF1 family protein [Legionella bononiensis]MBL7480907.1 SURF1 family protein [Legionella bononiensis]MBL7525911.1 SURF1 family protein [Legionella bononiensis]MBL7564022.1 SURF1 family protein [Legionella bononiensis]